MLCKKKESIIKAILIKFLEIKWKNKTVINRNLKIKI
jgi:hypothetical protein